MLHFRLQPDTSVRFPYPDMTFTLQSYPRSGFANVQAMSALTDFEISPSGKVLADVAGASRQLPALAIVMESSQLPGEGGRPAYFHT